MDFSRWMSTISENPGLRQLVIVAGAVALALLVRLLFLGVIKVFTRKTKTDVDDRIARQIRGPLVWTIILIGVSLAYLEFGAPARVNYFVLGIVQTVIALMWAVTLMRVGRILLEVVSVKRS